ncbi:MAG: hypothetical protein MOB07_14095 [Acidobacteria bacterium]|nr:hypothetical protein [Acidobacteriota bacterium]
MENPIQRQPEGELMSTLGEALESIAARIADYEQNKTADWVVEEKRAEEVVKYVHKLADDTLYNAMESGAAGDKERDSPLWEALEEISYLRYVNVLSFEDRVSKMAKIIFRTRKGHQSHEEIRTYGLRFLLGHRRHAPTYPRDAVRIASVLIPKEQNESDDIQAARLVLQEAIYSVMKEHSAGKWGIRDIAETLRSKAREDAALRESKNVMGFLSNYDAIVTAINIVERFEELERKWEKGE